MKYYSKPEIVESVVSKKCLAPLAVGAALAGGYVIGKAIKDAQANVQGLEKLERVVGNE